MLIEQLNCLQDTFSDSAFLTDTYHGNTQLASKFREQQLYITQVSINPVNFSLTHHDIPTSSSTTQAE